MRQSQLILVCTIALVVPLAFSGCYRAELTSVQAELEQVKGERDHLRARLLEVEQSPAHSSEATGASGELQQQVDEFLRVRDALAQREDELVRLRQEALAEAETARKLMDKLSAQLQAETQKVSDVQSQLQEAQKAITDLQSKLEQ